MSDAIALEATKTTDLTPEEGKRIVAAAATWLDTKYALMGAASSKGESGRADCSGSTWRIYEEAGFPYRYQATATFLNYVKDSGRFRELKPEEARQDGDVLFWPGHIAISSSFTTADSQWANFTRKSKPQHVTNDMWSATHPGGAPFGPAISAYWFGGRHPRVFRYQK